MQSFTADMDSEIDKTGFTYVKQRALKKSLWASTSVNECTLGPDAKDYSKEKSPDRTTNENIRPKHIAGTSIPKYLKKNSFYLNSAHSNSLTALIKNKDDNESNCVRKILSEISKLSIVEAQENKYNYLKKLSDHDKAKQKIAAEIEAAEEAELLKFAELKKNIVKEEMLKYTISPISKVPSGSPLLDIVSNSQNRETVSSIASPLSTSSQTTLSSNITKPVPNVPPTTTNAVSTAQNIHISPISVLAENPFSKTVGPIETEVTSPSTPAATVTSSTAPSKNNIISDQENIKTNKFTNPKGADSNDNSPNKTQRIIKTYLAIHENQEKFSNMYKKLIRMIEKEEVKTVLIEELKLIRGAVLDLQTIVAKCKEGKASEADVTVTEGLVSLMDTVVTKGSNITNQLPTNREEVTVNLDDTVKARPAEEKKEEKPAHSNEAEDRYLLLQQNLEKVEATLKAFLNDDSLKKFRSDCQKAVNIPVNAISPHDSSHMADKFKRLLALLQGQTVIVSEKRVTASTHPLGTLYSMYYLAKKIVKQGEHVVSSKPLAAFAIASVVIALWTEMPEFGKLLLAEFYNTCPYLIPRYWERTPDMSKEEHCKKLGFLYHNGEKEEINMFLKRQGGVVRLYGAIIITPQRKANQHKEHPLPLSESWRWLASFINIDPKAYISATLLLDMLDVTGSHMMNAYKCQFKKLLYLIVKSYLPLLDKVTPEGSMGPVARLRSYLGSIGSGKALPPPKGVLPYDFW